jgi:O-antigen ligase
LENASTDPNGSVPFLTLGFLLVFAPLFLGGNRPQPLLVLELVAIAGIAVLAWQGFGRVRSASLPAALRVGVGLLVVVPLLQLIPLPAGLWSQLPGHGPYFRALGFAGDSATLAMRPLSLHPRATEYSWLVILPCLAAFLLTLSQSQSRLKKLVAVFVGVAVCEAILGVLQLGAAAGSPLYLGNPHGGGAATGTYVNRNHFAALIAMALPMAVALWFLEAMPSRRRHAGNMRPSAGPSDRKLAKRIALSGLVLFLLVALLFSLSRGGIGSGFLAFSLACLALVWKAATMPARIAFAMIGLGALALAAYIGLTPVLERFTADQLSLGYDGREQIALASIRAGLDFLPLGSGLGTYADVFRRYQIEGLPGFIDHAHNDYAELFLELGVVGIAIVALLGTAYLMRWAKLAPVWREHRLGYLQVAAGLGILAMLVHALADFNFHIPANAIYFSFLAGVFFFSPHEEESGVRLSPGAPPA